MEKELIDVLKEIAQVLAKIGEQMEIQTEILDGIKHNLEIA